MPCYHYYHCTSQCGARFRATETNDLFLKELNKFIPRAGRPEVYKEVLNEGYKNKTHTQTEDVRKTKLQLEQNESKLAKARDLLLNSDIEASDFRVMKTEYEKSVTVLEARLANLSTSTARINTHLDKAVSNLSNLDKIYEEATIRKKRDIIVSIYPEKMTFDGFDFRTTRMNEVVSLIYGLDAGFREKKNRTNLEKSDLSGLVGPQGFEPRQTGPKPVVLPLYYGPIP